MGAIQFFCIQNSYSMDSGIFDLKQIEGNNIVIPGSIPLTLLCDNVKDPGNMGSLLRCAAAVGCEQFLTTKGITIDSTYESNNELLLSSKVVWMYGILKY